MDACRLLRAAARSAIVGARGRTKAKAAARTSRVRAGARAAARSPRTDADEPRPHRASARAETLPVYGAGPRISVSPGVSEFLPRRLGLLTRRRPTRAAFPSPHGNSGLGCAFVPTHSGGSRAGFSPASLVNLLGGAVVTSPRVTCQDRTSIDERDRRRRIADQQRDGVIPAIVKHSPHQRCAHDRRKPCRVVQRREEPHDELAAAAPAAGSSMTRRFSWRTSALRSPVAACDREQHHQQGGEDGREFADRRTHPEASFARIGNRVRAMSRGGEC